MNNRIHKAMREKRIKTLEKERDNFKQLHKTLLIKYRELHQKHEKLKNNFAEIVSMCCECEENKGTVKICEKCYEQLKSFRECY